MRNGVARSAEPNGGSIEGFVPGCRAQLTVVARTEW